MTDKKPNNPPAFPRPISHDATPIQQDGMTLRDYFAGQVIGTLIANNFKYSENYYPGEQRVEVAYQIADLMLKERDKA